jgi:hypothetical protein
MLDDVLKGGNLVTGLVIGAGTLIIWPVVSPILRPLAKATVKGGILGYREATRLYARAASDFGDIIKEAAEELAGDVAKETVEEVGADLVEEAL